MEELRNAIALLFKRKGRDSLSEREFVLSASMDLRWFPPRDAQRLLQVGLETKLLESRDGTIRPVFDVSAVEVPRDYVPTTAILAMPTPVEEDLFLRVVDAIAAMTGMDRKAVIHRVNEVQEKMDVEVEVAALIAARQAGVDVAPFLPAVRARLQLLGDHGGHRARPQGRARYLVSEAGAVPAHGEDRRVDGHGFQPRDVGAAQFADQENSPVKTK